MATMAAYRILDWQRAPELVDISIPVPGADQARVRVAGCGLCHSDLSMAHVDAAMGDAMGWQVPFTLGHETAGWIDAVGANVSGLHEGDPVAVASPSSCGACRWCRRGLENACPNGLVGRGYGRDGGLASYVLVDDPERVLFRLGQVPPEIAGPLTDAGATAHHAVRRVAPRVAPDGAVVVLGAGGMGAFAIQLVRALTSARVIAVDPSADRRALALELGAHDVVDGVDDDTRPGLRALLGSDPVDAVIDLVGTDATILLGSRLVSPGGALAVVGAAGGTLRRPWFSGLPRDAEVFTFQGSDLADGHALVALASEGRLRVDVDRYRLADVEQAYAALETGALRGRAVVAP